jgi:4a-hydroxytetrahydrobiopterin dehydratase
MSEEDKNWRMFSKEEIRENLSKLKKWKLEKGKLHREYEFKSFEQAICFMTRSAIEVSKLDHHPEWFNVYNIVKVDLVTHELGGISGYDFLLAKKLESAANEFKKTR